ALRGRVLVRRLFPNTLIAKRERARSAGDGHWRRSTVQNRLPLLLATYARRYSRPRNHMAPTPQERQEAIVIPVTCDERNALFSTGACNKCIVEQRWVVGRVPSFLGGQRSDNTAALDER